MQLEFDNELLKQNNKKLKAELHHCKAEIESHQTNLKQHKEALKYTRDEVKKYKAERDTLIDDISWYKAKVSRLERENEKIRKHNKGLQLKADGFFNKWVIDRNLLSEISQHIGNKPSSSTYKYFRGKLNALEIEESE